MSGARALRRAGTLLDDPVFLVTGTVGAFVIAGLAASSDDGPVLCVLRRCSGGYCPGCGLTRSAGLLLRGDPAGSWARHPYLLLAVAQVFAVGLLRLTLPARLRQLGPGTATVLLAANVALLLGMWLLRLATGAIPVPFG